MMQTKALIQVMDAGPSHDLDLCGFFKPELVKKKKKKNIFMGKTALVCLNYCRGEKLPIHKYQ